MVVRKHLNNKKLYTALMQAIKLSDQIEPDVVRFNIGKYKKAKVKKYKIPVHSRSALTQLAPSGGPPLPGIRSRVNDCTDKIQSNITLPG